jgi:hypothetical protein
MWARAVRYENVSPENWDVGREWFKNDYLPVMVQTEGFVGGYLLHDMERMCTMSLSLWRDEETLGSSGAALKQHLDAWAEMTGIEAAVETYEVVHAEVLVGVAES